MKTDLKRTLTILLEDDEIDTLYSEIGRMASGALDDRPVLQSLYVHIGNAVER